MSMGRNLLAGLANSIWSALIGLAVVPFYLKYLGIEAYGLIGFFVTTQAVLSLLDMGMAPTINREVARCSASGNLKEAGKLLHTLAVVYWSMAVAIALLILALAPLIAGSWLQSKQLSPETITRAVMLMGLVVACRWPIGLYQGALIGAQRLALSSSINMVMITVGSLGAVFVLACVSPTIEAFFIWQVCAGIVYVIIMRMAAWRIIGRAEDNNFSLEKLKQVWRFTAGMGVVALMGVVFTQIDKVLLSKILGLEEYAHYMLATVVASSMYVLITPVYNVVYPRFSAQVANGDEKGLLALFHLSSRFLAIVLFPVAMVFVVFSGDMVRVWTGNEGLALGVAPIVALLIMGSALNGIMFVPHAVQLAYGLTRLPLIINGVLMIIIVPLIIFLALKYGAVGAAVASLVFHVFYVLLGTWLTDRHLLKGAGMRWLFNDIGIPLGLTLVAGALFSYVCAEGACTVREKVAVGGGLIFVAAIVSIFLTQGLTSLILGYFRLRWR